MEKETQQTEIGYIKLYKNSKNYNWEIKLFEGKDSKAFKDLIEKIDELNNIMLNKFGAENE